MECGAFSLSALYGNCAVKLFHNLIDKRQADACSRFFVIVSLIEFLEDVWQVLL